MAFSFIPQGKFFLIYYGFMLIMKYILLITISTIGLNQEPKKLEFSIPYSNIEKCLSAKEKINLLSSLSEDIEVFSTCKYNNGDSGNENITI